MKILFTLLLTPLIVLAQSSSENFVLTKSVIDAGGGESSSENFEQVNAYGQPSPLGIQTSENFTLHPGFLGPEFGTSPLSPIQELVIWPNQPDAELSWEAIPGAASYSIYRDTAAVFSPDGSTLIGTSGINSYTDSGITATAAEKYFYIVTSSP